MKILVSFEDRVRPDSTGVYIREAFKQLGHEVTHVLPEKISEVRGGFDLYVKVDDGQRQTWWNPELHPSAYFCIDTHIESDWRIALARDGKFDHVSVTHSQGLALDWGRDDVYWNPVGCDPEIHFNATVEKIYDGCFIGNFHNNLAGPRVEALDAFFKECGPVFFGARMFREMAEKYSQSRLVFNRSINGDANMRVFEAMCSGSCLITDRVPDLDTLGFVSGVHYAGYSSIEELQVLTRILLTDDVRRERIATAGHVAVVASHKYTDRVQQILKRAFAHGALKGESPQELVRS